ncbi:hypothetical protein [Lactobacillus sp. UCMA15818]|uniref:hypothetical protein n=1 Tax=Lactobacillus sp. UCMA15818 TaxID=2583394 RepID=UPI0025B20BC7|nr:hypothetical protein [Lactobacillus sp. UCMA15818]MDN2452554.1 hypothetical protein [Lactobacillus sp. UCMA15818]
MNEEEFDRICDRNFDELVELVKDDYEFIDDLLNDNANSDAVFGWFQEHKEEVFEELGIEED